jgi:quinol monooxygenase YgiN
MPVIVVTRLRLRDPSLLDEFFTHAAAVLEQAMKSEGNIGADALAEAHDAWWSLTAWEDREHIETYVNTDPHLSTEALLDHLCDEATFVDWEQANAELPDWLTSWRHLVADGHSASLTNPSPANQTRSFPAPVEPPPSVA